MEGVDGGDVGEEVPHHLQGEGALGRFFRQTGAEHLREESEGTQTDLLLSEGPLPMTWQHIRYHEAGLVSYLLMNEKGKT